MDNDTNARPTDDQVCDAMRTMEDAIGVLRCSNPHPEDRARLLTAMSMIAESIRRNDMHAFSPYKLAIAIGDAKQVMREAERRPPAPRPSRFGFMRLRRPAPRYRIIPGGPPTTRFSALIARLRYGKETGGPSIIMTAPTSRFGKGTPASVFPSLIDQIGRDPNA